MFHVKPPDVSIGRLAAWLDHPISSEHVEQLQRYAEWLVEEGTAIGGIGPEESERVWDRHILDSLTFGFGLTPAQTVLDVGSGVGLPGIPLALVFGTDVTILDRSGRRIDAVRRVAAILGLSVGVVQSDVHHHGATYDRVVFRASLTIAAARKAAPKLSRPGGEAWFGLGRGDSEATKAWRDASTQRARQGEALVEVPTGVLDSPAYLIRMQAS